LRLSSFGGYGLALAALALVVFGAIECPPNEPKHIFASDISREIQNSPPGFYRLKLPSENPSTKKLDSY